MVKLQSTVARLTGIATSVTAEDSPQGVDHKARGMAGYRDVLVKQFSALLVSLGMLEFLNDMVPPLDEPE